MIDADSARRSASAVCIAMALVVGTAIAEPTTEAGTIVKIVPPVYLRTVYLRGSEKGPVVKLTPANDTNRLLHAGDAVRCGTGGSIVLNLHGNPVVPTPCTTWYEIPYAGPEMPPPEKSPFTEGARPKSEFAAGNPDRRMWRGEISGSAFGSATARDKADAAAAHAVTRDKNNPNVQRDDKPAMRTSPSPAPP
jgi:hypothetical protein